MQSAENGYLIIFHVEFEVLTAVMKSTVFWVMASCSQRKSTDVSE